MKQTEADDVVYTESSGGADSLWSRIREALGEFLGVPLSIVMGFVLLAALVFWLDQSDFGWVRSWRQAIAQYLFRTSDASGATMGLIGSGLLTMTSLVISMLLHRMVALRKESYAPGSQPICDLFRRSMR